MSNASIIDLVSTETVEVSGDNETNPRRVSFDVPPATATTLGSLSTTRDLGGTGAAPVVTGIQGITVDFKHPQHGDALRYDATDGDPDRAYIGGTLKYGAIVGGMNRQTGTSYTLQSSDRGKLVTFNNASAVAVTLPDASTLQTDFECSFKNIGAGTVTLTPATSTIDGVATLALTTGQGCDLFSDNTNYETQHGAGGGGSSPLTTKGDIYTYSSADARLAVGANGKVLMADSTQTTGIKWATLGESDVANLVTDLAAKITNPMTTKGDIIVADTSGVPTRVAAGSTVGQVLTSNGSAAAPSYQNVGTVALPTWAKNLIEAEPAAPMAEDDEFYSTTLDPKWTVNNPSSATINYGVYSSLVVQSPTGSTNGGSILQSKPSTPCEFILHQFIDNGSETGNPVAGICFSDGTKYVALVHGYINGTLQDNVFYHNTLTSFNSVPSGGTIPFAPNNWSVNLYLKLKDDGTNFIFSRSLDGRLWNPICTLSRTAFLASGGNQVGIFWTTNSPGPVMRSFDFFRRTL
jgi:hypothetical protein